MGNIFNKTHKNVRHGDLVFSRIEKEIKGKKTTKSVVLAEGEFTGHSHQLRPQEGGSIIFLEPEPGVKEFEVVGAPAILTHEEHKPITFNPGKYRVEIQEEYDYFTQEMRQVRD